MSWRSPPDPSGIKRNVPIYCNTRGPGEDYDVAVGCCRNLHNVHRPEFGPSPDGHCCERGGCRGLVGEGVGAQAQVTWYQANTSSAGIRRPTCDRDSNPWALRRSAASRSHDTIWHSLVSVVSNSILVSDLSHQFSVISDSCVCCDMLYTPLCIYGK
ncbi:hypothetical protein J6590_030929 [Homalodisca vitripennis]|nr:hypothetical protein J6590_030929 [Homalodisca vitripennis]